MLSKHWDHSSVFNMIMKLLITRGPITLIPKEATQDKSTWLSMCTIYKTDKQLIFLQEGRNRILSKDQILVSCSHMTCYLQNLHYISIYIFY